MVWCSWCVRASPTPTLLHRCAGGSCSHALRAALQDDTAQMRSTRLFVGSVIRRAESKYGDSPALQQVKQALAQLEQQLAL